MSIRGQQFSVQHGFSMMRVAGDGPLRWCRCRSRKPWKEPGKQVRDGGISDWRWKGRVSRAGKMRSGDNLRGSKQENKGGPPLVALPGTPGTAGTGPEHPAQRLTLPGPGASSLAAGQSRAVNAPQGPQLNQGFGSFGHHAGQSRRVAGPSPMLGTPRSWVEHRCCEDVLWKRPIRSVPQHHRATGPPWVCPETPRRQYGAGSR